MYQLLIVDDEEIMREGLSKLIDWESMGFQVAGQYEDGREVIDHLKAHPVDVVLADIKMTFVSGLDLAKYIKDHNFPVKVVFLSGYQDFNDARRAIDYNVVQYLLKPVSLGEIKTVFSAIRADLDREQEHQRINSEKEQQHAELMSMLKEQFFTDIALGALRDREEIEKRCQLLGFGDMTAGNQCCLFEITIAEHIQYIDKHWNYSEGELYSAVANLINGRNRGILYAVYKKKAGILQGIALQTGSENGSAEEALPLSPVMPLAGSAQDPADTVVAGVLPEQAAISYQAARETRKALPPEIFSMLVREYLQTAASHIQTIFGLSTTVVNGHIFRSMVELAKDTALILPQQPVLTANQTPTIASHDRERLLEQQKLLLSYIRDSSIEPVLSVFDHMIDEIIPMGMIWIQNYLAGLFADLHQKLDGTDLPHDEWQHHNIRFSELFQKQHFDELRQWGHEQLSVLTQNASRQRQTGNIDVIARIKQYIQDNCSKDITLEDIGDHVFLSAVYVSRLFKERTGENFGDYLIAARMEKAKSYLDDFSYKVYEIAPLVGYKSTKHFFRLFKRYEGCTPLEYRNRDRGRKEHGS